MEILLLQSDFYGPVIKAIQYFKKILEPYECNAVHVHGAHHKSLQPLVEYLENNHADYIIISVWCYNNMVFGQMLDIINQYGKGSSILIGGWFSNLLGLKAFQFHPRIDYVCLGDGDDMIVELATGKPPDEIEGIYARGYNEEIQYRKTDRENEVMIPGPSIVPLSGCSSRCKFCSILTNPQNFWVKSEQRVEKEIVYQKQNGIQQFYLGYDNVLLNRKKAVAYAKLIKKHECHFATTGRADQIDEYLIATLAENNCTRIDFGVESISERLSSYINKNIKPNQLKEIGNLCRKYGLLPFAFIITGLPTEDVNDRTETEMFLKNSDFLLFEINRYKDYLGSEFSNEIRNYEKFALSRYYQYEVCYGLFDSEQYFIESEANYRYMVMQATRYMVEKMIGYFGQGLSEIQRLTYWQSFRDATLDTTLYFDESSFEDKQLFSEFTYWYNAKKFQNMQRERQAGYICDKKFFINKLRLEEDGVIEKVYVNESAVIARLEEMLKGV